MSMYLNPRKRGNCTIAPGGVGTTRWRRHQERFPRRATKRSQSEPLSNEQKPTPWRRAEGWCAADEKRRRRNEANAA